MRSLFPRRYVESGTNVPISYRTSFRGFPRPFPKKGLSRSAPSTSFSYRPGKYCRTPCAITHSHFCGNRPPFDGCGAGQQAQEMADVGRFFEQRASTTPRATVEPSYKPLRYKKKLLEVVCYILWRVINITWGSPMKRYVHMQYIRKRNGCWLVV